MNPGDVVYKLGTVHLDNGSCLVEVLYGVVPKTGEIRWSAENIAISWDQISSDASSFRSAIDSILAGHDAVKDVVPYEKQP